MFAVLHQSVEMFFRHEGAGIGVESVEAFLEGRPLVIDNLCRESGVEDAPRHFGQDSIVRCRCDLGRRRGAVAARIRSSAGTPPFRSVASAKISAKGACIPAPSLRIGGCFVTDHAASYFSTAHHSANASRGEGRVRLARPDKPQRRHAPARATPSRRFPPPSRSPRIDPSGW